jgi:hypothetical protein
MLHHLIYIASHLNQFENDPLLRNSVLPMKTKFAKFWNRIPMLYSFAFVLDPRAKVRGYHKALTLISNLISTDHVNYYESVRAQLTTIFTNYDLRLVDKIHIRNKLLLLVLERRGNHGGRYMVLM